MNAVASHPRDIQQLWRHQNSAPDVQRVDPNAYQDLNGNQQLEAPAGSPGRPATARGRASRANSAAPRGAPEINEKAIHSADVKPSRSRHILILDGQPAARFWRLVEKLIVYAPNHYMAVSVKGASRGSGATVTLNGTELGNNGEKPVATKLTNRTSRRTGS